MKRNFLIILLATISLALAAKEEDANSSLLLNEGMLKNEKSSIALSEVPLESPVDSTYIIGTGDAFEVFTEGRSQVIQVGPEGSFIIDGVGGVKLSGLPLPVAKDSILGQLSRKYARNLCFVQLIRVRKYFVGVYGAVADPRQFYVSSNLRISYLLRQAGWFHPTADREHVKLIRGKDTTNINFLEIENKGSRESDIITQQGDVIYVPYIDIQKGMVTFKIASTIRNIPYVEGATVSQYMENLDLLRFTNGYEGFQYTPSLGEKSQQISLLSAFSMKPQKGSTLEVIRTKLRVTVGGAVAAPGPQEYQADWHAVDYVSAAGIMIQTGSFSRITVTRKDGSTAYINAHTDPIYPGDYMEIPRSAYEQLKDFTMFLGAIASIFLTVIVAQQTLNNN